MFLTCAIIQVSADTVDDTTTQIITPSVIPGPSSSGIVQERNKSSEPTSPGPIITGPTRLNSTNNSSDGSLPTTNPPAKVSSTTGSPSTTPDLPKTSSATTSPPTTSPPTTSPPTTSPPTTSPPTTSPPTTSPPTTSPPTPTPPTPTPPTPTPPTPTPPTTVSYTTIPPTASLITRGFKATSPETHGSLTKSLPTKKLPTTSPPKTNHRITDPPTTTTAPTRLPLISGSSKSPITQGNVTTPSNGKTSPKAVTSRGSENSTEAPLQTAYVNVTQKWNHTKIPDVRTTSGSSAGLTATPSPVASVLFETSAAVVTDNSPVNITAAKETTEYVTLNVTSAVNGSGLNPDHEKDELKRLLLIIGCSVGAVVTLTLIIFAVVYRVAKKRAKDTNSRYYNFKKKASRPNYEKVLHLKEYCGELDTDTASSAGTGAAWVFQENDQDASKTITLEFKPKDKNKSANRSGKPKNRNKNKNNSRGNYQVLAEMYPTKNIPPDVLLSADGAVHSDSEDDDGAEHETTFGPVMNDDKSDGSVVTTEGLSSKNSFNDGGWPTWNTSPFVKITQDEAVVEL